MEARPAIPLRNERVSPWSLLLLALVILSQVAPQLGLHGALSRRLGLSSTSSAAARRVDVKDILQIDFEAKTAYANDYAARLGIKQPELFQKMLEHAIDDAEDQLRDYPSDLSVARRLMILRAELGRQPLMAVSADRHRRAVGPPLAAFDAASPDQAREANLWRALYTHRILPHPSDASALASEIKRQPTLGWYRYLALHQVWLRSGDFVRAGDAQDLACRGAIGSIVPLTGLYVVVLLVGLAGVTLLVSLGVRSFLIKSGEQGANLGLLNTLAVPLPEPVVPAQRRLGAGDLFNLFVVCMVLFALISRAIEYGATQFLFPQAFAALTSTARVNAVVDMVSASQLATTLVAAAILLWQARLRGWTILSEIGLNFRGAGKNVLAGVAGWGIALPMIYLGAALASHLFPNTPDPSNPAIDLTIKSSGLMARAALFVTICVLAPIFEETMFRGLFYQAARAKIGIWPAIVLTGIVFGLVHPVSIVGSIPLMLLGSVFAWLAETRKSLLPGMVAHGLQNLLSFLSMLFLS
ncbi:MAG: type II CAAX endopeptidase family protein [Capsulimonadaceae bacterium]|nr:type II CAAX endopeptidase family protein [Capsulimonadaceae bacterium]